MSFVTMVFWEDLKNTFKHVFTDDHLHGGQNIGQLCIYHVPDHVIWVTMDLFLLKRQEVHHSVTNHMLMFSEIKLVKMH